MRVTRWQVGVGLAVVLGLVGDLRGQDLSKVQIRSIPVAKNLYLLIGGGGNIALSVGDDGPLLVDAGYEQQAEKVVAAVGELSKQPVRKLIDTHWHFDHVGGNTRLSKDGAVIVAHQNVRKRMSAEQYIGVIDERIPASPAAALPTITFSDRLTLYHNGDEVRVLHVPAAHTDGDSIVYFVNANVLHVGDTWFNGMYPFFDVNAGGTLDGIVAALDVALGIADDKTQIIPGHGRLSDRRELQVYRDMLAAVRDRVRKLLAEGKSRAEVIAAHPTREYDERWGGSWLAADVWVGMVCDGMGAQVVPVGR